ncbi:MAG TPA: c-type cytochrome [Longimicrobiales bacterium]|nr:c-type cytochrome [Longimicrobiales bacterium]
MRPFLHRGAIGPLSAFAVAAALASPAALGGQQPGGEHPGRAPYQKWCAGCHGVEGDGEGPAADWMLPRPRDFRDARYQIRTTPSGALPTDADILRVIDEGMPGTAMPGWKGRLSRRDRANLVDYLKTFSRFFAMEDAPERLDVGRAPGMSRDAVEEGREIYQSVECWKCHGQAGRGDGPSAPTQTDDRGFPIRPADLTEPWFFNGGGSVEAVYTRLLTGLDGTPMPSFSDLISGGIITDEQLWHVALYVRSLAPESSPDVREVVRAGLVGGALPSGPSDEAWDDTDRYYIPLVGQIIVEPRWFSPTVDGVWVQALHDGEELALRLTWHDPSRSPDPAWEEWRRLLTDIMEPREGEPPAPSSPDVFTVQFPTTMPEGRDLPYFLGGDPSRPAYLWRWQSDTEVLREALGRGLDEVEILPADDASPRASAEFEDGQWRLVIRRPLETADPERRLAMPTGEAIPIAFFAQDGSSGEAGHRGSISSWYFLYLDRPASASVYIVPVAAALLTALLGLGVVARARQTGGAARRETETLLEGA